MRYLTSALISEGVSDDQFLPRLLGRALIRLCLAEFDDDIDVADVLPLRAAGGPVGIGGVLDLVDRNSGSFLIVFLHHDQGANAERVEREWLTPLRERWGGRGERLVPVVPVRETEAWSLVDGDALRCALGVRWTDADMGLPARPGDVEGVSDPKLILDRITRRIRRSRRDHFGQLGELVSLDRLALVPAYRRWRDDARDALTAMGFRRR